MQATYQVWQGLFENHHLLLVELQESLNEERKALLAHDIPLIQSATARKEKVTHKIELSQKRLDEVRLQTARELGFAESVTIGELFLKFDDAEKNSLMKQRQILASKTKQIAKLNQFNSKCLVTYKGLADGFEHIFNNAKVSPTQTYNQIGRAYSHDQQRRFLDRSL